MEKILQKASRSLKLLRKSFTAYQIIYLGSVVLLTGLFVIFLPDEMLDLPEEMGSGLSIFLAVCSVVATIANPLCELLISKQSKYNFLVSVLFVEVPETVLYLTMGWYSTAFVTILFWIPIDIISFVKWHRHPDLAREEITVVKKMPLWLDLLSILAIGIFSFTVGTLLTFIPGACDSYVDALVSAFGMANGILLLLRYNEQWYAWFITLILEAVLYIMSGSYIMLITVAAMMVNTVYGYVKWIIYTKSAKSK